jgi:hypothetical protein
MRFAALPLIVAAALVGCGDKMPTVDVEQARANAIPVSGETLTRRAFLDRYCPTGNDHPTCVMVRSEETKAAIRKPLPKNW